ncbi:MAG: hypothetical protein K6C10_11615 [Prevotella sp.]|nr:hypothetical protein [Prevotella sp.]
MKKFLIVLSCLLPCMAFAQKKIFIPEDLQGMNLNDTASKWCYQRSVQTENLIFFWEKGFGDDLQNPPSLEGHPMRFDLQNLEERVESFYHFFRDTLKFTLPGSKSEQYKMMVMIMYSLDGTAYGGTYDDFIGALWVAPNRIQDRKLNCLAHELGHSFQLQIPADKTGEAWGGSGFYEMTSQWMLWQVNPDWVKDEQYHFDAFKNLTHKAYLAMDNIYHSPYVIQWWSDLRGKTAIGDLYRAGKRGEDPVITYKRLYGLSQKAFCDETFRGYQHLVNFDFKHAQKETRPYACTFTCKLDTLADGWLRPENLPEEYGFNAIPLPLAKKTRIEFVGDRVRYGFVGVTTEGESIYGEMNNSEFRVPKGKQLKHLYLVVMGAPNEHEQLYRHRGRGGYGFENAPKPTVFPYQFRLRK